MSVWPPMPESPNSRAAIERRYAGGGLSWSRATTMVLARPVLAVIAGGAVAGLFAWQGSASPWRDAAGWFPVYGTAIDAGCLALLWRFTQAERIRLIDLVGFDRARCLRDLLFGLLLIPPSLVFILGGNIGASLLVYGIAQPAFLFSPLPLPAALYAALVFPLVWGFTEQMTYNGYGAPRLQVLSGSTLAAVALVALPWAFQHAVMPVTFDAQYVAYRMMSPIPFSIFSVLLYLRIRRLLPFAIAHWLMDGGASVAGSLLPLLR